MLPIWHNFGRVHGQKPDHAKTPPFLLAGEWTYSIKAQNHQRNLQFIRNAAKMVSMLAEDNNEQVGEETRSLMPRRVGTEQAF